MKMWAILDLIAICLVAGVIAFAAGCKMLDRTVGNNDGVFNPDVSVAWEDANGQPYSAKLGPDGVRIEGVFTGPVSGLEYYVTDGAGIRIRDPRTGATLVVAPKAVTP